MADETYTRAADKIYARNYLKNLHIRIKGRYPRRRVCPFCKKKLEKVKR